MGWRERVEVSVAWGKGWFEERLLEEFRDHLYGSRYTLHLAYLTDRTSHARKAQKLHDD